MKKVLSFLAAVAALACVASCNKTEPSFDVKVALTYNNEPFAKADVDVTFADAAGVVNFQAKTDANGTATFNVKAGSYTATAVCKSAEDGVAYTYSGEVTAAVSATTEKLELRLNRVEAQQIIIKELYNTGCPKEGGSYSNDAYVTLYNNSDMEADASNLVFGLLQPGNAHATNKYIIDGKLSYEDSGYVPAYSALWFFQNPVKIAPYSSLTVAIFGAINHTETYEASVDLSKAEYYVMAKDGVSQITNAKYQIAETIPADHYLSAYMFNAGNAWVLSNSSPAFFIGNMDKAALKALVDNTDDYDTTSGTTNVGWAPKFPVANVVDAVDVWAADQIEKSNHRFPAVVNNGHVAITSKLGHTVYRNVDKAATEALAENKDKLVTGYAADESGIDAEASLANGAHIVFMDTNNSGADFHEREKQALKK